MIIIGSIQAVTSGESLRFAGPHAGSTEGGWIHALGLPGGPQTGQPATDTYFLLVLEAGSPRSRCHQAWLLLGPVSLACGCPLRAVCSHGPSSV